MVKEAEKVIHNPAQETNEELLGKAQKTTDLLKKAAAENQHRAGGKILDRSRYVPNPLITPEMKDMARAFSIECKDKAWEAELYPFGENTILRWVTT